MSILQLSPVSHGMHAHTVSKAQLKGSFSSRVGPAQQILHLKKAQSVGKMCSDIGNNNAVQTDLN